VSGGEPVSGSLGEANVRVWLKWDDLKQPLDLDCLSDEERSRGEKYRVPEKRRQFYFSRVTGRKLFGDLLGATPQQISWSASGVPDVSAVIDGKLREIRCSLSHSGQLLAIAIGPPNSGLGIDVEFETAVFNPSAVSHIVLTESERLQLEQLPVSDRNRALLHIWTVKEAALKSLRLHSPPQLHNFEVALGRDCFDLSQKLNQCSVSLLPAGFGDSLEDKIRRQFECTLFIRTEIGGFQEFGTRLAQWNDDLKEQVAREPFRLPIVGALVVANTSYGRG